jgi:hypothetical protein
VGAHTDILTVEMVSEKIQFTLVGWSFIGLKKSESLLVQTALLTFEVLIYQNVFILVVQSNFVGVVTLLIFIWSVTGSCPSQDMDYPD